MANNILAIIVQEGTKMLTSLVKLSPRQTPPEKLESPEEAFKRIYQEQKAEPVPEIVPPRVSVISKQPVETACVPCIPPSSLILTNPNVKQVKDIIAGDKVLAATGSYSTVLETTQRPYDGELISISVPYQNEPIVITPEHPLLAIRAHRCSKRQRICLPGLDNWHCDNCSTKRIYQPEFVLAGELSTTGVRNTWVKHILLMPILKQTRNKSSITLSSVAKIGYEDIGNGWIKPRKKNAHNRGRSAVAVKNRILIDDNFMALAGFYLSEGSVTFHNKGANTTFDFGKTENDYAEQAKTLLERVFGISNVIIDYHESTIRVTVPSLLIAHFFANLFGKGALNKQIPEWILTLPREKQKGLLKTYWRGDGSQWINNEETQMLLSATTVSRTLAYSLRILLHRLAIIHNLDRYKTNQSTINGRIIKSNGYHYALQVWASAGIKLAKILDYPIPRKWRPLQCHQAGIDNDWLYLPIKSIKRVNYKGPVMNLQTKDNTYTVAGIAVHNCSLGHYSTSAGLLNEAIRFKKDGITSREVLDRIAKVLEEQNALERVDLTPEKLQGTPEWERALAEEALVESRRLRHKLEAIENMNQLEEIAANTETFYKDLSASWFKQKLQTKGISEAKFEEMKTTAAQRAAEEVEKEVVSSDE